MCVCVRLYRAVPCVCMRRVTPRRHESVSRSRARAHTHTRHTRASRPHTQERLEQQRAEAKANPEQYGASFKPELSKDEKKQKRKQILASIGACVAARVLARLARGSPAA